MSKSLVLLMIVVCPAVLAAQVGHAPERSPYRDITGRTSLVLQGGLLGGSGGLLDIGPTGGALYGFRLETVLSGPTDGFLGFTRGRPERMLVDPTAPEASRVSGPESQSLVIVDAGLTILLAGEKTWNGLAPFVGASLGMGFATTPAADTTSGFRFNAKLVTGPHVGVRWYATRSISLRAEGRLLFWQLKYPSLFFQSPAGAPNDPPVLDPASSPDSEWTSHPVLHFGLGIAFRL
ncbi:MAG: hypothetical protein WD934_00930 [Gemmatimonadales bacterium]